MPRDFLLPLLATLILGAACGTHGPQPAQAKQATAAAIVHVQMYSGRDLQPHVDKGRDPTLPELKAALGTAFGNLDPYRSLMIYDCAHSASLCTQDSLQPCQLLSDVLGADQAKIAGTLWFASIKKNDPGTDTYGSSDSLCGRKMTLLSIVNRMDLAESADDGKNWQKAELRFVYAAEPNFNLILEFVLRQLKWSEFQVLANRWADLSKVALNDPQFIDAWKEVLAAADYKNAPLARIRTNREATPQGWRLGEWDFKRGTPLDPDTPLLPSPLDQQLKDALMTDQFKTLASATSEDAKSVNLNSLPFLACIKKYSSQIFPMPNGIDLTDQNNLRIRNMIALQQCTGCHFNETGIKFAQVSNAPGTPPLSHFLIGEKLAKPTIDDLYRADCKAQPVVVWCTQVLYDQNKPKETRIFHDLGRRLLFLSAVMSAPATDPGPQYLEYIRAFNTDFTH